MNNESNSNPQFDWNGFPEEKYEELLHTAWEEVLFTDYIGEINVGEIAVSITREQLGGAGYEINVLYEGDGSCGTSVTVNGVPNIHYDEVGMDIICSKEMLPQSYDDFKKMTEEKVIAHFKKSDDNERKRMEAERKDKECGWPTYNYGLMEHATRPLVEWHCPDRALDTMIAHAKEELFGESSNDNDNNPMRDIFANLPRRK